MRLGQRNKFVFLADPVCSDKECEETATTTLCKDGKAIHYCHEHYISRNHVSDVQWGINAITI